MYTFFSIVDLLKNTPLIAAVVSFLAAQSLKMLLTRKFSTFKRYGGMPSGHASAASGLAFSIGRCTGYSSPITAVAAMLLMVIVADAVNLRPHVRDDLGHTWSEAFAGIALGFLIAHLLPAKTPLW